MLNRLNSKPPGARLLLFVFLFAATFNAFHLVKGIATFNVHFIVGGTVFTATSLLLTLIFWHGSSRDDTDERTKYYGKSPASSSVLRMDCPRHRNSLSLAQGNWLRGSRVRRVS